MIQGLSFPAIHTIFRGNTMKFLSYAIGASFLLCIGLWAYPSLAGSHTSVQTSDPGTSRFSIFTLAQELMPAPNPQQGPPCLTPYGCSNPDNAWTFHAESIFIPSCDGTGPPCEVYVEFETRLCDGICDIYIKKWEQYPGTDCSGCPPTGPQINHEDVVRATISFAMTRITKDRCPIAPGDCEENIRVTTAACGELVYTGTWEDMITQVHYLRNLGWRPCDEAFCCIAIYEVCVDGNTLEPSATLVSSEGHVIPCEPMGCQNFCGDLPTYIPPFPPDEV